MKKMIALIVSVLVIVAVCVNASAAGLDSNKQKILDALKTTITVDGKTISLPSDILNQAENYLLRDDVVITADQANTIIDEIEASVQVVKDSGVTSISQLSGAQKSEIINNMKDAGSVVDLTVTVDSAKNQLSVLSGDKLISAMEPALKVTGPDVTSLAVGVSVALALLAGCYIVARKGKLLAK